MVVFSAFTTRYNAEKQEIESIKMEQHHAQREAGLLQWLQTLPGLSPSQFHMISGDASFRRYFRFHDAEQVYIAVDAPPATEKNQEFVALSHAYSVQNVPVPKVIHADLEQGYLMLEDLGDVLFSSQLEQGDEAALYTKALRHLPAIQQVQAFADAQKTPLPKFDAELLDAEFCLFNHWLLNVHLALPLSDVEWNIIHEAQRFLAAVFMEQPQAGVHRDYHSRNLMLLGNDDIGVIDFQDAVVGPITYDAVSLLRDCYVVWPDDFVEAQLRLLHEQHFAKHDWTQFKYWFDCVGMQRHIKASGIFARLCHRDGKTGYLNDVPRTLQYLVKVGSLIPECAAFALLVESKVIPAVLDKAQG